MVIVIYRQHKKSTKAMITNFEQCIADGRPILETYPEQCVADGQTFTNTTQVSK